MKLKLVGMPEHIVAAMERQHSSSHSACTAIILRLPTTPSIRVLECDGPADIPPVNRTIGGFVDTLSFQEWCALPEHLKDSPPSASMIDWNTACRMAHILKQADETQSLSSKHLRELRWRLESIYPYSAE